MRYRLRFPHLSGRFGSNRPFVLLLIGVLCVVSFIPLWQRSLFFKKDRLTIVWATNPVWVSILNRDSSTVSLLRIPSETAITVPGGFGNLRIGVLWRLGAIEKKGGQILSSATQTFLGAPVNAWIGRGSEPIVLDSDGERIVRTLSGLLFPISIATKESPLLTNLSFLDRLAVWWFLSRLRLSDVVYVDLASEKVVVPTLLADDSHAQIGDPDLVDKVSQRLFWEPMFKLHPITIRILNGSGIDGAGYAVARLLSAIGVNVIGVNTSSTITGGTCILTASSSQLKTPTLLRIKELYGCLAQPAEKGEKDVQLTIGKEVKIGGFL